MNYTKDDLLVLGKRYNNPKRSYLLIDPLQAKHIPVSPSAALEMMRSLGRKIYAETGGADCIIGFAETATAVAAAAAEAFDDDTFYIHTTREDAFMCGYDFTEEYSHAPKQRIYAAQPLFRPETKKVILIDDEYSTGKTLMNFITQIKRVRSIENAAFKAGSVINRISAENLAAFREKGVDFYSLINISSDDYEERVRNICVSAPVADFPLLSKSYGIIESPCERTGHFDLFDGWNMRIGASVGAIKKKFPEFAEKTAEILGDKISAGEKILVMGTEEFMYPALILGEKLESMGMTVFSHSTTRSPIGVSDENDYPIRSGYKIHSFYDKDRETYIYNTDRYDKVIVVTDSKDEQCTETAMRDIMSVFEADDFYLVR